jgi:uncharacterized protein (DUF1778 family)
MKTLSEFMVVAISPAALSLADVHREVMTLDCRIWIPVARLDRPWLLA